MKKTILTVALLLIDRFGKTSTKEVKDACHRLYSTDNTFSLTQTETSDAMADLYLSEGWHREINKSIPGVQYYDYSLPQTSQPVVATAPQAAPAPQPISQATPGNLPLDAVHGNWVAYISGKYGKMVQGNDKNAAKKAVFAAYNNSEIGLTYDNINVCSVAYFNSNHLSKI